MMCEKPFMRNPVPDGKKLVTYDERLQYTPVACGQCFPCRVNKSRIWTIRIMLEAAATDQCCFVTLTYSDDFLPKGDLENGERVGMCCLDKRELQNYIKRLRKRVAPITIRYFGVGEYGELTFRPHYHLVIFGLGIEDERIIKNAWKWRGIEIGLVHVGELNNHSARYITNYAMKNLNDMESPWVKERIPIVVGRTPEFMTSSKGRRSEGSGGIGYQGLKKVAEDWRKSNVTERKIIREFRMHGKLHPLGRYMTKKMAELIGVDESEYEQELWDYQEEIFGKFIKENAVFYDELTGEMAAKRASQKVRKRMFRQKRSI